MRTLVFIVFFFTTWHLIAQMSDDFSDGDLSSDPAWTGDIDAWTVNDENQLQLNAAEPATFRLFTQLAYPDSVRWSGYALYDFAPSNNNNGALYLAIDNLDLAVANGYLLRYGENNSDDAIRLFRLDAGTEVELGVGTLGAVSSDPAEFAYSIKYNDQQTWTVSIAYQGGPIMMEFQVDDATYALSSLSYFGVEAKVTSSNVKKVYFDDFIIEEDLPDTTPPVITDIEVVDQSTIRVYYNEAMNISSISATENYLLQPGTILPSSVSVDADNPSLATLNFDPPFPGSTSYTMTVAFVEDAVGNLIEETTFEFFIADSPGPGDLLLSELLFDPYQVGEDFVEIYNVSDKILSIDGIVIANQAKDEMEVIESEMILHPKKYLAISSDTTQLIDIYSPPDSALFLEHKIPTFNNTDGNLSIGLMSSNGVEYYESFDYEEDLHFSQIDDTEGVSLERLSFSVDASNVVNWFSGAERTFFATPGYANTSSIKIPPDQEEFVRAIPETFSPNQDGHDDLCTLLFSFDKPGFLASVKAYDYRGQEVATLAQNRFLGEQDFILWDGQNDEGRTLPMGPYILFCEAFHPDGEVFNKKLVVILAEFLD